MRQRSIAASLAAVRAMSRPPSTSGSASTGRTGTGQLDRVARPRLLAARQRTPHRLGRRQLPSPFRAAPTAPHRLQELPAGIQRTAGAGRGTPRAPARIRSPLPRRGMRPTNSPPSCEPTVMTYEPIQPPERIARAARARDVALVDAFVAEQPSNARGSRRDPSQRSTPSARCTGHELPPNRASPRKPIPSRRRRRGRRLLTTPCELRFAVFSRRKAVPPVVDCGASMQSRGATRIRSIREGARVMGSAEATAGA